MSSSAKLVNVDACVRTWLSLIHRHAHDLHDWQADQSSIKVAEEEDDDITWADLPDILLEEIYTYLNGRDRLNTSLVCKRWNEAFYFPRLWEHFQVSERTFVYRRISLYRGYQYELSHMKAQMCLTRVGKFFRTLVVHPLTDYFNLYEFLHVLNAFLEFYEDNYPLPLLKKFLFTFACETQGVAARVAGSFVHGTGGKILQELKRLLGNLKNLQELRLNQLLLDTKDAHGLLDSVLQNCSESLEILEILNCTKEQFPLFQVALFMNLKILVISPQQLSQDVIAMLPNSPLKNLVLVQDSYTDRAIPVSGDTWREVKRLVPDLKVRLELRGNTRLEMIFQNRAPVSEIIYKSPYSKVSPQSAFTIAEHYWNSLLVYAHFGLPKVPMPRSFIDRADTSLVLLVRRCPHLHTLVIRERVSTCTLLVIAKEAIALKAFYVRRNAIIKRFDWPKASEWTDEFYQSLKVNSRSYNLMEAYVSKELGFRWCPLSDKEFKHIQV